jgi:hypothetical protein
MRERPKDRKALVTFIVSFILLSYWFSNWDAFEQFLKAIVRYPECLGIAIV